MKRYIAMLLAILLLGAAALAEEAALPGALARDTETIIDLDGDGAQERVSWTMAPAEDEYDPVLTLTVTPADGAPVTWQTPIICSEAAYIVDLDGDGTREVLLTGDEMSDDYLTYCLRWMDGGLYALLFPNAFRGSENGDGAYYAMGYGMITDIRDGRLTLCGSQDVLGTWFGARSFALTPLSRFEFADDGLWVREDSLDDEVWEYCALTVTTALPYADLEGHPAGILNPGDKIVITASDKRSFARFAARDGRTGSLNISPDCDQGWGWLVNGLPEARLFEYIPYAD